MNTTQHEDDQLFPIAALEPWPPVSGDPYRDPVETPVLPSQFGGLWTDMTNANAIAEGRRALGQITDEEYEVLTTFIDKGYAVLKGAVAPGPLAELNEDLERVWNEGHERAWVSARDQGQGVTRRLQAQDHRDVDSETKLLDIHEYLESARRAQFSPVIQRFLEIIFDRPALAHQSLAFYRGSKQPLHQDTVFVRISSPRELVASWIALEDIQPGSGELEYTEGSHKIPDFLFEGRYKWFPPGNAELPAASEHVERETRHRNLETRTFCPKAGDVFIWAADLAHGGSAYDDASQTRKSLVTHYCPANCYPMYFHYGRHSGRIAWSEKSFFSYQEKLEWRG